MRSRFAIAIVTTLVVLIGCSERAPDQAIDAFLTPPPPPQVGDVSNFHHCSANPSPTSSSEACLVERLKAECTAATDCLLTCMASPDGRRVGGGCEHVCFGYPAMGKGEMPRETFQRCNVSKI